MTTRTIVTHPDPSLKRKTKPVDAAEFGTDELMNTIYDLFETMTNQAYMIAIAGPQIGVHKQILALILREPTVMINPVIKSKSGRQLLEEGCVSVPGVFAQIPRPDTIVIEYSDEYGNKHDCELHGVSAAAVLHGIDLLQGRTILDTMRFWDKLKLLFKQKRG